MFIRKVIPNELFSHVPQEHLNELIQELKFLFIWDLGIADSGFDVIKGSPPILIVQIPL